MSWFDFTGGPSLFKKDDGSSAMMSSFAKKAEGLQGTANASAASSVSDAQSGLSSANSFLSNIYGSVAGMQQTAQQALATANRMGGNISQIEGSANRLTPFADTLQNYGSTLWTQGRDIYGQGQGFMGTGNSILNMNADPNSLAGQYVAAMRSIDPNRYVSMAAADVQSSFSNAQGQMQRSLGRQGVAADSGRSAALQQQWAQALAAAQSGAKTRARMVGSKEKLAALQSGLGVATGLINTGSGVAQLGIQAQGTAGNMQNSAAGIVGTQGQLFGQAGQLRASQAGVQLSAGQLQGQSGQLSVSAANASASAAQMASQAQMQAANYYAQVAQGYGAVAGTGNLASSLGFAS
jgi:hypothetical protein